MYKLLHHTTTKFYLERTWIGMGKTCEPKPFSFQCMTKFTTNKKKKERKNMDILAFMMTLPRDKPGTGLYSSYLEWSSRWRSARLHVEYRLLRAELPLCLHYRSPRKYPEWTTHCSNPNMHNALQPEFELYLCTVFGVSATKFKRPLQFLTLIVWAGWNVF